MARAASLPIVRVEPPKGLFDLGLHEIWRYRQLAYFLAWRDVKVRYKQTLLGGGWAILQPFLLMVVFSVVFGRIAKIGSEGLPYPIFAYAALVPWTFFAQSVQSASLSLVTSQALVTKIYIPRLTLPAAAVGSTLLDFVIALTITGALMVHYSVYPTWDVLWIFPLTLLAMVTALAVGIGLAALNAMFRDVRYVTPFFIQAWLFATPVVFSSRLIGRNWRWLLGLNPMAGVVEGFRWALLGTGDPPSEVIFPSLAIALAGFVGAVVFFKWSESRFVDVI